MKTKVFIFIGILVTACVLWGCAGEIRDYDVEKYVYVNKSSLNMYIGDEVQLTASPVGESFVWSSDNESIAIVSQTGLVKAISEGLASIIIKYGEVEAKIEVKVRTFIPLTDINLSKTSAKLYAGDKAQIWAYSVPENASEVTFTWRSENPAVATVDKNGIVTAVSRGITNVIVGFGSIEKIISISVPELYKCDKTGWTVEVSDERTDDGGGKNKMIDGDYATNTYWHSQYGPDVACPHWAVIDMKEPVEVGRVVTMRRNGDTKTVQYFVGDSPDANADTWVKIIEGAYASKTADHTLTLNATQPVTGRYLKLVLPDSFRYPFIGLCEVDVYGLRY